MPRTELQIAGKWIAGDGETFQSTCPVDESVVWEGNAASAAQIDQAYAAARRAFGPWWDKTSSQRIEIAECFRDKVKESADELALLIARPKSTCRSTPLKRDVTQRLLNFRACKR